MEAIIIGATGAIGKVLVRQLLCDDAYSKVTILVRSPWELTHDKLNIVLVDFEDLEKYSQVIRGNVAFNCMGTTIKAAKTRERMEQVDCFYPLKFAQICKANGVEKFVNISSMGASDTSLFYYSKLKAKLERELEKLAFESLIIIRPSALVRPNSDRRSEKYMVGALRLFNKIGMLKASRPVSVVKVADCMRTKAIESTTGTLIVENNQI